MKEISTSLHAVIKIFLLISPSFGLFGCDKVNLSASPVDQASEVIKRHLKSPSSFNKVEGEVLWSGKTEKGKNTYVVSVMFDAANSFGAMIRGCMYVAYSEAENSNITWKNDFGVRDYSENLAFCDKSSPISVKKELAKGIAEINWEVNLTK